MAAALPGAAATFTCDRLLDSLGNEMKRMIAYGAASLALVAGLAWCMDYLHLMSLSDTQKFATYRVDQLYTIHDRWNQIEWSRGDPVMERCVNSLFPHLGNRPCWYV